MAVVFAAALLVPIQLLGQADSCLRRSIPVNVLTDRDQIVTGLTESNFTGSMHHQPVKILSVEQDDSPRRVVIVLDASGSMTRELGAWQLYLAAGRNLIAVMPSSTLAGLVVFSSEVEKNIPLTTSRADLQDEFTSLHSGTKTLPRGGRRTALRDALAAAAAEFDPPQNGDAIYAITDGHDNASKLSENSLRENLVNKHIRLFTLSVNMDAASPHVERIGLMNLPDISSATGGYAVDLSRNPIGGLPALANGSGKPTTEGELLMKQFRLIFSFQRLEIQFPEALEKTQDWNLNVTGVKARNLTVVYPHKLAVCP